MHYTESVLQRCKVIFILLQMSLSTHLSSDPPNQKSKIINLPRSCMDVKFETMSAFPIIL